MNSKSAVRNTQVLNAYDPSGLVVRVRPLTASIQRVLAAGLSLGMSHAMAGELPIPKAALVTMGRADQVVNGNKMVINQYSDRAVLNWETFNIGKDNSVQFKQPSAVSVALNRIGQSDPSRILGNLSANGQVYLLNPNGFVFGKDATVNVNTLVATNLNITDDTFERGITKVFNQDGRAALTGTGQVYRTDADGNVLRDARGNKIKIGVEFEKGAKVLTDKSGRVIVAAPSITNRGELSTPDGQILMVAATDKVYLQETSGDPSLRGLVVEVATGGDVTNIGKLVAARGNVTLAGFAVNQEGRVSASTAVQANGSVRLLAREGAVARRDGDRWVLQASSTTRRTAQDDGLGTKARVTLATDSVTEATPDLNDKAKAVDGQTQEASRVEIMGKQVRIENNATLRSHAGQVSITATENPSNPGLPNVKNDSKVVIAQGAKIDVSGIKNVSLAMERNVAEVELRSNELRDAPVQKNGPLFAKKVKVDIRKGTPIADITGALDRIARSVAERSTSGGSLAIASEGDALLAKGARIDLSGGSVRYRSGYVNTSILIGPDGRTAVDIGNADPNVRYSGLIEPFTRTYTGSNLAVSSKIVGPAQGGKYESGYVEGKSAGTLDIRAAALALDAEMQAAAINGSRQRSPELQAAGGRLSIDLARTPGNNQEVRFGKAPGAAVDPDQDIATHPDNPQQPLALTVDGAQLRRTGLQAITINTNGRISVDAGHTVELVEAGALTLHGGDIDMAGNIKSLAGKVDLQTQVVGGSGSTGSINLRSGSSIDTRGGWNNDRPAISTGADRFDGHPLRINGGTVAVKAEGDVNVEAGSRIDVSGGAHRQLDRKIKAGDAGSISLEAAAIGGSDLSMQGTLLGHAVVGGRGGSLTLVSDQVQLGFNGTPPAEGAPVPLFLDNQFFTRGGFAHYTLGSNKSGVAVSDFADIQVRVDNRILEPAAVGKATGADLRDFSQISLLPVQSRPAGEFTLQLAQKAGFGGKDAAIRIGEGAAITTDARGKINLKSDGSIFVNGALTAKGGEVTMNIGTPAQTDPGFLPHQGIWLGMGSSLDVSGASLTYQDGLGRMTGDILDGGKISLHADRGFIVADIGASMNVSGTAGLLDLPVSTANLSRMTQRQLIASDAGHIDLKAAEGMQLFGSMKAHGGGPGAAGGDLRVELNPFTRNEPEQVPGLPFPRVPSVIAISQNTSLDQQAPEQGANVPASQYGQALISADQVSTGGFSSVTFRTLDRIDMHGDVTLSALRGIALDAPVLAFKSQAGLENPQVLITAPHVALGSTQTRPGKVAPTGGQGSLQVAAGLIDLTGTMALQGYGSANLASSGDLRLTGVRTNQQQRDFLGAFLSAGDLTLGANQIYPSTLTDFRIAVEGNPTGTLTVAPGSGSGSTPLSAGGKLTLAAPNIVQGGTLKAPIGEINLKAGNKLELAAGSITSNSAEGSVIPFGRGQGGLDWIYPLGQQNLIFTAPPEKKLSLEGAVIDVALGAVIDTTGGGDLLAFEHVPGPGGSYDILDPQSPGYQGSFAILPGYRSSAAPVDFLELPDSGLEVGDSLYLSGGGGLAAGNYVLLPAHYALLPGAYLVTPKAGTQDRLPGFKQKDANGAEIVSGYRTVAGTSIREPRWSGWSVEKGGAVGKRAEYAKYQANDFYTGKAKQQDKSAPYLPRDAGAILVSAGSGLNLDGLISAAPAKQGRGGRLDIAADAINVVADALVSAQAAAGSVQLVAEQLNGLNVASISLGGIRRFGPDGVTVDVKSNTVSLGQDARLIGQEFILAAKKDVTLAQGAGIETLGSEADKQGEKPVYRLNRDSAFVRVSNGPQASLRRAEAEGRSGNITLAAGSTMASTGSIMLDAAADNTLSGTLSTEGGSVSLGAKRISLGEVDFSASGLILDQARLSALRADELILNSGSDISLYGATAVSARQLTLHSAGLLGFNNAGREASLQADALRIDNASGVITSRIGNGNGNLTLSGKTLTLGEGEYELGGFSNVRLAASGSIRGDQTSQIRAAANLDLITPLVTGGRGANTRIDATGHAVNMEGGGATPPEADPALGGRLAVTADSIRHAGTIALASGGVMLNAVKGDVLLDTGSVIDVAGRTARLGKSVIQTGGGNVELAAQTGNVVLQTGSRVDLSGAQGGRLTVAVPKGNLTLAGTLNATGTIAGGQFLLDVGNAASVGNLGALGSSLQAAGFTEELNLRTRTGDWRLDAGDSLEARLVGMTADQGGIQLNGQLLARGADAEVRLAAADQLRLGGAARIEARGTAAQGGKVLLSAVDGDRDGQSGVTLESGALVDVRDGQGRSNGEVRLRADRNGGDVAVSGNLDASIRGSAGTSIEAVRVYEKNGVISSGDIAGWKSDTEAFMAQAETIEKRLGTPGGLLAGLEIKSSGDLTIDAGGWDLVDWRYGGRAGVLTLNAGRNLAIRGKLTDGFRDVPNGIDLSGLLGEGAVMPVRDLLQPGQSWSYQLNAGGDVVVGNNALVRTGTGDIGIDAGQDLVLGNATASIYTAGRPTDIARYGSFKNGFVAFSFFGEYPVDGGDIRIQAQRDVVGAVTGQFFDGWFGRTGNWSQNQTHEGETPTAWAIAIGGPVGTSRPQSSFNQNIGALGGGDVTVTAGRDVANLSVVIPTTGKQTGEQANPNSPSDANFKTNVVDVQGGGNLRVTAGSDVIGGTFYTGRGTAEINAAGSIRGSEAGNGLGAILALGDSRFTLKAGDSIELGAAINPTVMFDARSKNYFFTYGENSGIDLQALSGTVTLQNDTVGLIDNLNALRPGNSQIKFPGVAQEALTVYPATLNVAALQGDIVLGRSFVSYPSAKAGFSLLAGGDITTDTIGSNVNITQSDADPTLLPSVANPAVSWEDAFQRLQPFGNSNLIHAKTPVHRGDENPATIWAKGSIFSNDSLLFSLAKAAEVQAGRDLLDVSFQIQHPDYSLSSISAGRDIQFTTPRNAQGNLVNLTREVRLAGPGQLWVTAGRTIDLGASEGIYSIGNTNNNALAEQGASISIMAGMAEAARWNDFSLKYDPLSAKYSEDLTRYMQARLGDSSLDAAGAATAYKTLPEEQQREFLLAMLFREIRTASSAAARSGKLADYEPGFAAIEAMFPGAGGKESKYAGDLKLFFSKVHTVDGGDINLLVPGGLVNAGLAVAFAGAKPASELGIVAQREGAVNGFVNGDFLVNQSRVFAMDGGDITLWSSNGNIDAGRGAKAAIAAPPPIITFDEQGNLKVEFPPVVSGSGIRTAASTVSRPGDVYLAAPKGVVDAGEAGIGGSNITIAATAVIGASNIDVGGSATGVPSANVAVPVAPAGAAAAASAVSNRADEVAGSAVNSNESQAEEKNELPQRLAAQADQLTPLQIDILGFGECGVADIKDGKPGCV